eukprot:2201172-Amphidinium_carterae.2
MRTTSMRQPVICFLSSTGGGFIGARTTRPWTWDKRCLTCTLICQPKVGRVLHFTARRIAWDECLGQVQVRHAKGALFSRDDEADALPAEPEVTIDDHVDDGEEEVEEVPVDEVEAGEVDRTEVTLPAEVEPVKITKFMALRLVYGSASQKDLATANQL